MRKAIQGKIKGLVKNQFRKPVVTMAEKKPEEETEEEADKEAPEKEEEDELDLDAE